MKDLDPFFLLKMSSTFLFFNLPLRIEILFFKLTIFLLMPSNFLSLSSSKVRIADEGNLHEFARNLMLDVNFETWFEVREEDGEYERDEELLLIRGKISRVGGAFEGLLLGLRTKWDSTFEAKEDAIKVEVKIARWVFFFFR